MTETINVDPAELRQKAAQLQACKEQLDAEIKKMDEAVALVMESWMGKSAGSFRTSYSRAKSGTFKKWRKNLAKLIEQLNAAAAEFEAADQL